MLIDDLAQVNQDAIDISINDYVGVFKARVFNDRGAIASDGIKVGVYQSDYWKQERAKRGFSTGLITYSFSGELERSIKIVNVDKSVQMVVTPVEYVGGRFYKNPTTDTETLSNYIDANKTVFEPTRKEIEDINSTLEEIIEEKLNEIFKNL